MAFNAEDYLAELSGGKKRKGSCNNRRKKKSCKKSGCGWTKRSKSGSKAYCRKSPKGSKRRSKRRNSGRRSSIGKMGKAIMGCAKKMYKKMSKGQKGKKGAWQNCVKQSAKKCKNNGYKSC
jgi:hypothetical protein